MNLISVVVPFLNEEENLDSFCEFIDSLSVSKNYAIEAIFVDDGSTDLSVKVINEFNFQHCVTVKIIKLTKNFGSHAAARAAICEAQGDYCVFIGADLQEPADMIDSMYNEIIHGYHMVCVEKRHVEVSLINKATSAIYTSLMKKFAVENYGSGAVNNIMFDRKVIDFLNENIELNSSLNLQIINTSFKSKTIQMDYNRRNAGHSKWTFSKKQKLFIDSFVSFSYMPLHIVTVLGIIMAIIGVIWGLYIIIARLVSSASPVSGYASIAALLLFGFGATNISLGILAAYLWRTFDVARKRPAFIIDEIIEHKKNDIAKD
jgi:dolichol-phosphate mannosyltransferase